MVIGEPGSQQLRGAAQYDVAQQTAANGIDGADKDRGEHTESDREGEFQANDGVCPESKQIDEDDNLDRSDESGARAHRRG